MRITMTKYLHKASIFAALLGILALPVATATADTSNTGIATTTIASDSAEHVDGGFHSFENGISDYDGFDQFRDSTGHPLPGWDYLFNSPG
jgi:hypothetical protein